MVALHISPMHKTTSWLVFEIQFRGRSSGASKEPMTELRWFDLGCVSCWWPQGAVNMARTRQDFLVHTLFSLTGHHGHGQIFLKRAGDLWTPSDWISKDYCRSAKSQVLGMKFAFLIPVNSFFYPETTVQCSNTASLLSRIWYDHSSLVSWASGAEGKQQKSIQKDVILSERVSHKQSCIKHSPLSGSQNTMSWSTCNGISLYACHMKRFTIWLEAHHLCETWCMSHAYQDFRNLKGLISCLCYNRVSIQESMSARIYLTKGTCLECISSLGRWLAWIDELHPKSLKWLEIILTQSRLLEGLKEDV